MEDVTFRDLMAAVCSPVAVVTATDSTGRPHGTTVSSLTSLSLNPPMVLVALGHTSGLLALIRAGSPLGINVLGSEQSSLARHFASKGSTKFDGVDWTLADDLPRLPGANGWLACTVDRLMVTGDHTLVIATVNNGCTEIGMPLTYHRREFGTHTAVAMAT